jgi:DNA-binding NtrC family response regulator
MRGDAVHLSHHGQRKTILIVDDDADLRSALAEQLELHEEFAAAEAPRARTAYGSARNLRPS